jgi:hypothetical protein
MPLVWIKLWHDCEASKRQSRFAHDDFLSEAAQSLVNFRPAWFVAVPDDHLPQLKIVGKWSEVQAAFWVSLSFETDKAPLLTLVLPMPILGGKYPSHFRFRGGAPPV